MEHLQLAHYLVTHGRLDVQYDHLCQEQGEERRMEGEGKGVGAGGGGEREGGSVGVH